MYREHFGLTIAPFGISPRLDFIYASSAFSESKAHLVYGLESNEAIVMITGAIGTGKTMTVQSFLSQLGERHMTALVTNTSVDAKELLKLILDDLDAPLSREADKSDLLIALKQMIIEQGREGRRVIIIIDEAQNLAPGVLEEIRLLTNLGQGDQQPVQVILVGQPELEHIVARPELAQLRQRIRVHYRLVPLTRQELGEYVDHRMVVAGGRAGTFTAGALDRVFALSSGVPRVVNTLCNDALLAAFVAGHAKVEAQDVEATDGAPTPVILKPETQPAVAAAEASVAPSEGAATPRMAVKREAKAVIDGAPDRRPDGEGRSRRGWLLVPLLLVAAAVAVLASTGRFDSLLGRHAPSANTPEVADPAPAKLAVKDSLAVAASDSNAAAAPAKADSTAAAGATPTVANEAVGPTQPESAAPSSAVTPSMDADKTAVPTAAAVVSPATVPDSTGPWFIHVSSYKTQDEAAKVAARFTGAGHEAMVREQMVNNSTWFRVYLGPYGERKAAVKLAEEMRGNGTITYYQVQRLEAVAAP